MQVTISYHDNESFTKEEVVRQAVHNYGKNTRVEVLPDSTNAHDFAYFAVQQMITHQQLSLIYDKTSSYQKDLAKLRSEVVKKLEEIVDAVIVDNESKVE
jgi:hypothetical protein